MLFLLLYLYWCGYVYRILLRMLLLLFFSILEHGLTIILCLGMNASKDFLHFIAQMWFYLYSQPTTTFSTHLYVYLAISMLSGWKRLNHTKLTPNEKSMNIKTRKKKNESKLLTMVGVVVEDGWYRHCGWSIYINYGYIHQILYL